MKDHAVVVGSFNYDIFFLVDALPRMGESLDARKTSTSPGGKGCNQAVQIAKLGTPTYMIGCLGNDAPAEYLIGCAKDYGLDVSYVCRTDNPSGIGVNFNFPDGSTCGCSSKGSNRYLAPEDIDRAEEAFSKSKVAVFQLEVPLATTRHAMSLARRKGLKIIFNPSPVEPCEDKDFSVCDVLIFNEVEAEYFSGTPVTDADIASRLSLEWSKKYNCGVIITLGHQGSVVSLNGKTEKIPVYPVQAVSATGAGDSFLGGIAHYLMEDDDLFAAARFAAKCAAFTVCTVGCQNAMPTIEQLENF